MLRLLTASRDDWTVRVRVRSPQGRLRTRIVGVNHHNTQDEAIALARKHVRPPRKVLLGLAEEILDMDIRRRWQDKPIRVGV